MNKKILIILFAALVCVAFVLGIVIFVVSVGQSHNSPVTPTEEPYATPEQATEQPTEEPSGISDSAMSAASREVGA